MNNSIVERNALLTERLLQLCLESDDRLRLVEMKIDSLRSEMQPGFQSIFFADLCASHRKFRGFGFYSTYVSLRQLLEVRHLQVKRRNRFMDWYDHQLSERPCLATSN